MKVLGYRAIPLSAFRADLPRPDGLSDAIDAAGLIHEPVVRESDMQIVCGHRRIAAHRELKEPEVMCKIVEGTDDEVLLWRLQENSYRHDLTAAERAQAIRETFAVLRRMRGAAVTEPAPAPDLPSHPPTHAKPGPHGGPKKHRTKAEREARAATAAALGVGRQVVAEALDGPPPSKRAAAEALPKVIAAIAENMRDGEWHVAPEGDPEAPEPPTAPNMDTFGLELDPAWLAGVAAYDAALEAAHRRLVDASSMLGRLLAAMEAGEAAGPARRVERLRGELRALMGKVTGARAAALCWYCKGAEGAVDGCAACGGCGVGVRDQEDAVPAELKDAGRLRVSMGGRIVDMPGWEQEGEPSE